MEEKSIVSGRDSDTVQTIPLAYHEVCMERNRRILKYFAIGWAASVVLIVWFFVYMWLQYDYVSTTEYSGIYNLTDSAGNVISSDIMPEDIPGILEAIYHGNSETYQNQETQESQRQE